MTLLEQLDKGTLWRSPGGIHPPEMKSVSNGTAIAPLPLFAEYLIPLPQVGEQAILAVKVGDEVRKGQALTQGQGVGYLPAHAPTSGRIKAIESRPSNHASALPVLTLVLESDGQDKWCELNSASLDELSPAEMVKKVQDAGIAGMGGAAFPSHIKLSPASEIELVIVNGVECEPYITADDRLMREHADDIIAGVGIVERILAPKRIIIAIEDNKPEAADAMRAAINRSQMPAGLVRVTVIPTKYPSGGEKQLIQIVTGQEVPSGAIPAQLGILVHNVGTLFAIRDAVIDGKPLIERIITVTGNAVSEPGNYRALIGTKVQDVLDHCGFRAAEAQKIIMGGPMMGYTLANTEVPLLKGSNCLLVPNGLEITEMPPEKPCIRCGECAVACPALLLPQQLFWHAKAEEYDKAQSYNLKDCIECGCCSYVCPSDIPLVEYYRVAKAAIRQQAEEKASAERAKVRFEARIARLEEEKAAREAKAKEAAEKRKAAMAGGEKDAIAAALARVQAKKAAQGQAAAQEDASPTTPSSDSAADPKAGVAAAIARAKAKKAALASGGNSATADSAQTTENNGAKDADSAESENLTPAAEIQDTKRAAVASAIAKAKAKKAAKDADDQQVTAPDSAAPASPLTDAPAMDDKAARVAAAVAKAKAKKLAAGAAETTPQDVAVQPDGGINPEEPAAPSGRDEDSPVDEKAARVAAAVAKAKAKAAAKRAQVQPESAEVADIHSDTQAKEAQEADIQVTANMAGDTQHIDTGSEQDIPAMHHSGAETLAVLPSDAEALKKARIAAAVAKAKAKKAAKEHE
nr:electron transport complex subunit RsxC [Shewanella litorisediminis]